MAGNDEALKIDDCDCDGEGCEYCTCRDCGKLLQVGEEDKCQYCIEREEENGCD